jgi:hypothetical protein
MANASLATYLNDHLAGSVAALDLLTHLQTLYAGTPFAGVLASLAADVAADRQELEALLGQLQIPVSRTRQVTAWLAEKLTALKLRLDDPAGGALRRLEALEAVALGIEGKRALWRALEAAAAEVSVLRGVDYARLSQRAEEQRQRVEAVRVTAATTALSATS